MTREEAKTYMMLYELKLKASINALELDEDIKAFDMAIKALEREPKTDYKAFAEWVSTEIFSKDWEYNKDSFAEIACRKLNKLGVVDTDGTMWIYENEASEQEPENEDMITHIEAVQDNLNRMVDSLDDDTGYYDATYHLEQIKEKADQEPKTDGDCISRDMALEKMADYVSSGYADSANDFKEYSKIICELPSVKPQEQKTGWNNHQIACMLADLFGDACACNYNGIDEWLPELCDFKDTCCPNPVGVDCWEQFLKHSQSRYTECGYEIRDKNALQEPKTGHWNTYEIFQSGIKETWYECTKCKWSNALVIPRNYCPNCGCRMENNEN